MLDQKFNRLTVTAEPEMQRSAFSTRARRVVKCVCSCGKKVTVRLDHLLRGNHQSCGCLMREKVGLAAKGKNRSKVIVGKTYGFVTVIERLPNEKGSAIYLCKCECGNVYNRTGGSLTGGRAQRCKKCGNREHLAKMHTVHTRPKGEAACYATFVITRRSCAVLRRLAWEISYEDWKRLTVQPCHYCGCPPSNCGRGRNGDYHYNGLDRVDNDVGYTLKNVVPCCKCCNHSKSDQTLPEFLSWVSKVHAHSIAKSL